MDHLSRALRPDLTVDGIEQGLFLMRKLGGRTQSEADAKQEIADWVGYFTGTSRERLPKSVFLKVCADFGNGDHGDFFPLPKKVYDVCHGLTQPFRTQLHELRRYQGAVVEPPAAISEDEREARKRKVADLMAGLRVQTAQEG